MHFLYQFRLDVMLACGDLGYELPAAWLLRSALRKKRNRGSKNVEQPALQTFQNEAPGDEKWKPKSFKKWLQTWLQNGFKMAPK